MQGRMRCLSRQVETWLIFFLKLNLSLIYHTNPLNRCGKTFVSCATCVSHLMSCPRTVANPAMLFFKVPAVHTKKMVISEEKMFFASHTEEEVSVTGIWRFGTWGLEAEFRIAFLSPSCLTWDAVDVSDSLRLPVVFFLSCLLALTFLSQYS